MRVTPPFAACGTEVGVVRCALGQAGVGASAAVEGEVALDARRRRGDGCRDRGVPTQDAPAGAVEDRGEIREAVCHRDVNDIPRPGVLPPDHGAMPHEIEGDGVRAVPAALTRLRAARAHLHMENQRAHATPADTGEVAPQEEAPYARPGKREVKVQHVELPQHCKVAGRDGTGE